MNLTASDIAKRLPDGINTVGARPVASYLPAGCRARAAGRSLKSVLAAAFTERSPGAVPGRSRRLAAAAREARPEA